VRRTIAITSLVIAWLCANGALLDAMQMVAWSKMFADYAQTMTVGEALRETFNPARKCNLCRHVAKAKEAAQNQLPPLSEDSAKFVLGLQVVESPIFASEQEEWVVISVKRLAERTDPVPVPPPRV